MSENFTTINIESSNSNEANKIIDNWISEGLMTEGDIDSNETGGMTSFYISNDFADMSDFKSKKIPYYFIQKMFLS